jgi:gas vesicle protein
MTHENRMGYLFLGLGLGTAAGMLWARKAGAETRNDIERKMREGGEYIKQHGHELFDHATETVAHGKETVRTQLKSLSDAIAIGKVTYQRGVCASRNN